MEMVARPKIDEMKNIKFYDTDSQNQFVKDRAGVRGRKIFEITFIPTEPGDLEIPPLEFNYFDPRKGTYQILKSQAYQIKVSPAPFQQLAQISEEGGELKKTLKSERSDIYYIEENFNPARRKIPLGSLLLALFWGAVVLSFWAAVLWVKRAYEERLDSNLAVKRSLFAKRDLQRGMKKLAKICRAKTPEKRREYYDYASKLLNAYIAGKFNLSAQGLTMREIEEKLLEKGCEPDRLGRVEKFYQLCDEVRFTSAEVPEVRPEDFRHLADEICAFLEKR